MSFKKILLIPLLLIACIILVSCDPPEYYFDADEIIERAKKIELVLCKNDAPQVVTTDENTVLSFDFNNVIIVEELEQSEIENFANELAPILFHIESYSVNAPIGYAVIIYMENEEIIVISCTSIDEETYSMVASFTSNGDFIRHIAIFADPPSFEKLLEKYFDTYIIT